MFSKITIMTSTENYSQQIEQIKTKLNSADAVIIGAGARRYSDFIEENKDKNVVYLELGVGANTPVIIKYPFLQLTAHNKNAAYICVNLGENYCPEEIVGQTICVNADIGAVLRDLLN